LDNKDVLSIIEALLFVSDEPVNINNLKDVVGMKENEEILEAIDALRKKLGERALEIVEIAGGYQLRTRPEHGDYIKKFHKLTRATRLSPASIEVLSIIAYKQPITRQEIEDIRGVDSSGIVKKILEKQLIKSMGRKKLPGKPMAFGTTKRFLEYFGLVKISDLPTLKDFPEEMELIGEQKSIDFNNADDESEKSDVDIEIEEEVAMIEPAVEDYDDDDEVEDGEE